MCVCVCVCVCVCDDDDVLTISYQGVHPLDPTLYMNVHVLTCL